jgi:hypothetical protein
MLEELGIANMSWAVVIGKCGRPNDPRSKENMTRKKNLGKAKRVALKLSIGERTLILGGPLQIHQGLAESIRATPTGATVLLSVDDLEDLSGYVAAEANHATDKKIRKQLDAIFKRIDDLLETHSDERPPRSLNFEDAQKEKIIAGQAVELAEWAATMLIGAEQLGIKEKPVARFPLPWAERAVLVLFTAVDKKILTKLETEKPCLTVAEVGGLLIAVATALLDATPLQFNALLTIANSLMGCLEEEITAAIKPTPGSER